jgi:hypothetical protein
VALREQLDAHRGPLVTADVTIAAILSAGIGDVRAHLQPATLVEYPTEDGTLRRGEPGYFFFAPQCTTLAQLAFHMAAMTVVERVDVRTCGHCSRSFLPKHGRQQYCSPSTSRQRGRDGTGRGGGPARRWVERAGLPLRRSRVLAACDSLAGRAAAAAPRLDDG